jgi:hypothetical protein
MAHRSLLQTVGMAHRKTRDRHSSYVVIVHSDSDPLAIAGYLATLSPAQCDVVILDYSTPDVFEEHRHVLRWAGRHVSLSKNTDIVRAAIELAACEKVIVATDDVRYSVDDIEMMCQLLERHDVVEPQQYLWPLPWWSGIDAGKMLVHRGIERFGDRSSTYAFRRTVVRQIRGADVGNDHAIRRLAMRGADVHAAGDFFVRRNPPEFADWVRTRPQHAEQDFAVPGKTIVFLALIPVMIALVFFAGARVAGGFAGLVALFSSGLAIRGRIGAAAFYPLKTCLFAPVWVLERSISVYWALFRRVHAVAIEPKAVPAPLRAAGEQVASGE